LVKENDVLANHRYNWPTILEEGKKLQVDVLADTARGDGLVDIAVKFKKMADNANVELA
jgi:hypothetical protein